MKMQRRSGMARTRTAKTRGPEYEEVGNRIASARINCDMSQAEAASKLGIPQSSYSGYESGTRRIQISMIKKIADTYGVTVDYLLGTPAPCDPLQLTPQEYQLIMKFRNMSESEKVMLLRSAGVVTDN